MPQGLTYHETIRDRAENEGWDSVVFYPAIRPAIAWLTLLVLLYCLVRMNCSVSVWVLIVLPVIAWVLALLKVVVDGMHGRELVVVPKGYVQLRQRSGTVVAESQGQIALVLKQA